MFIVDKSKADEGIGNDWVGCVVVGLNLWSIGPPGITAAPGTMGILATEIIIIITLWQRMIILYTSWL